MPNNRKILLVEDNSDDIELTLPAFKKNNIFNKTIVKHDEAETLEYFFGKDGIVNKQKNDMPIVILLDLKLPKINGIDVLKKLKADEITKLIPIVILTSSKEPADLLSCYKLGCNSYIRKPVDFSQFMDTVKQLGLYWLLINEGPNFI
ncbi:MAG: two-component system response regulator [Smithella sp. SDB]|nr:MAG: two-component system response regulator [Smithella sp. SDB]